VFNKTKASKQGKKIFYFIGTLREVFEEVDYFEVVFLLKQRRKHAISFVTNF